MSGSGLGGDRSEEHGADRAVLPLLALAGRVGEALVARGWTLAVAESCTAGFVMKTLTDLPGSSRYLAGGVVAYANRVKAEVLGVKDALLDREGSVSEPVARAMAEGVSRVMGTPVGLAVTGIAGPEGGTLEKPVGTVWIAVCTPQRREARTTQFSGDRDRVREQSVRAALVLLDGVLARDDV